METENQVTNEKVNDTELEYKNALELINKKEEEFLQTATEELKKLINHWSEKYKCTYIPVVKIEGVSVEHSIKVVKLK